ncbi:hypothetical protein BST28_00060 [Mycolicibacter kumamotonensis]|uniref:GmrSD restriction endonucleases N-terminal domain-containing protein n=1 Tax=Mycolicibacter kumamotonensis TaxID=354243 RepID=A0A1X0EFH1_9MYCO|nr:DUF262 domain-containing protein [Mycolicibacter kumamotonensis]ORA83337.1 hypothetical protein BST28_00060 [Mycolicibacter kumamotonensis]
MSLQDQIETRAKEIHTDGYGMSIGEVLSMYKDGDLDIHPEFQRIFRWSMEQKSRLIESILLGIPIPPIFVSQRDDGVWDVIDGVQRLSTILQFVGSYRDHEDKLVKPEPLLATEYLPDLEGYRWQSESEGDKAFTASMQRDFKRSKLEFRIIRKESDKNAKYDLFQRLNSGSQLSPQEARNCLLVMLNTDMYSELDRLSRSEAFASSVPLSDQKENQAYREELVLRFFLQRSYKGKDSELRKEYGEYLTDWLREIAVRADWAREIDGSAFKACFGEIERALGEDAFRRFDGKRHLGPFSISGYEFITSGLAANLDRWQGRPDALRAKIEAVWNAPEFRDNSGTGVSPRRRVPRLILRARTFFAQD